MDDNDDFIIFSGNITNIRKDVDKKYIWFDIGKMGSYTDKDGKVKSSPSYFSAKIDRCYEDKINIKLNDKVSVKGTPKGYVDKKGYRQNYIHVTEFNGISINQSIVDIFGTDTDGTPLWNGKRCESIPPTKEEQEELDQLLKNF